MIIILIVRCEQNCPPQRWGRGCENFCNCKGHISHCHPETGHCTLTVTDIHSTSETTNTVRLFSTKIIEFEKGTTDSSWTTDHIVEEGIHFLYDDNKSSLNESL